MTMRRSVYEIATGNIVYTIECPDNEADIDLDDGYAYIDGEYNPEMYTVVNGVAVSGDPNYDDGLGDPDTTYQGKNAVLDEVSKGGADARAAIGISESVNSSADLAAIAALAGVGFARRIGAGQWQLDSSGIGGNPAGNAISITSLMYFTPGNMNFTVPANVSQIMLTMQGAGGGGSGGNNSYFGNGGGAGGFCYRVPVSVTPGATYYGYVGTGGAGGAAGTTGQGGAGGNGENTGISGLEVYAIGGGGATWADPGTNGGTSGIAGIAGMPGTVRSGNGFWGMGGSGMFGSSGGIGAGYGSPGYGGGGGGGGNASAGAAGGGGFIIVEYISGGGVPAGGTAGQTIVKASGTDGDAVWGDVAWSHVSSKPSFGTAALKDVGTLATDVAAGDRGLPSGGTSNQVLSKVNGTDYNVTWVDAGTATSLPAGGTTDQILAKVSGDDYDVAWVDPPTGGGVTGSFPLNDSVVGTTPKLVVSLTLPAGDYSAPSASIGCTDVAHAATCKLLKENGDILATIGGVAGGVQWRTAAAGFTLVGITQVDVTLVASSAAGTALIRGLRVV